MKWIAPLTVMMLMLSACAGEFDMSSDGPDTDAMFGTPGATNPDGTPVDPTAETPVQTEELTPGFSIERNEVRLLPFHVRVQKLAQVSGLDPQDPMFDEVWAGRYDLGDHNYGQGIGPDLSWNASKMAKWVEALQPLCASEQMATLYDLPADTGALLAAAYGRTPDAEEVAMFTDAVDAQMLDEAARYQAICLAILTSSEFVAQ